MNTVSWISALTLGLVGSLHCAGMCGPLALALPDDAPRARFVLGRLLYNLGRTLTYAAMGALFGAAGQTLALAGFQRGISLAAGAAILAWLLLRGRAGTWMGARRLAGRIVAPVQRALGRLLGRRGPGALLGFGLLNGLLPCGLVYLALAGAAATGSVAGGAAFMAVFGAGTVPMMLAIALAGKLVHVALRNRLQRLVPFALATLAALFILRGLALGIPYLSPNLAASATEEGCGCCSH